MLSLDEQTVVLDDLLREHQVSDVYFFKGRLYVVNEWDKPAVDQYIDATALFVETVTIES